MNDDSRWSIKPVTRTDGTVSIVGYRCEGLAHPDVHVSHAYTCSTVCNIICRYDRRRSGERRGRRESSTLQRSYRMGRHIGTIVVYRVNPLPHVCSKPRAHEFTWTNEGELIDCPRELINRVIDRHLLQCLEHNRGLFGNSKARG